MRYAGPTYVLALTGGPSDGAVVPSPDLPAVHREPVPRPPTVADYVRTGGLEPCGDILRVREYVRTGARTHTGGHVYQLRRGQS